MHSLIISYIIHPAITIIMKSTKILIKRVLLYHYVVAWYTQVKSQSKVKIKCVATLNGSWFTEAKVEIYEEARQKNPKPNPIWMGVSRKKRTFNNTRLDKSGYLGWMNTKALEVWVATSVKKVGQLVSGLSLFVRSLDKKWDVSRGNRMVCHKAQPICFWYTSVTAKNLNIWSDIDLVPRCILQTLLQYLSRRDL